MKVLLGLIIIMLIAFLGCERGFKVEADKALFKKAPGLYNTFKQYWTYRSQLDADKSFSLETPYIQFVVPKKAYKAYVNWFKKADLVAVKPYKLECEKDFYCCVDMKMVFVIKKDKKQDVREGHDCWVKVEEKWWHIIRNPFIMPAF